MFNNQEFLYFITKLIKQGYEFELFSEEGSEGYYNEKNILELVDTCFNLEILKLVVYKDKEIRGFIEFIMDNNPNKGVYLEFHNFSNNEEILNIIDQEEA